MLAPIAHCFKYLLSDQRYQAAQVWADQLELVGALVRNGLKLLLAFGSAPGGSAVAFVAFLLGVLQIGPLIVCSPILPTHLARGPKRIVGLMAPIPWDRFGPLPWA
jgi:hypothetical protein